MISAVIFSSQESEAQNRMNELRQISFCAESQAFFIDLSKGESWYGALLAETISRMRAGDDLYLTTGRFPITEGNLSLLTKALYEEKELAAVGGVSADFANPLQQSTEPEKAVRHVLYLDPEVLLIKGTALHEIGGFDEALHGKDEALKDWFVRVIQGKRKLGICGEAVYQSLPGVETGSGRLYEEDVRHLERKWGIHYLNLAGNRYIVDAMRPKGEGVLRVLEIGCDCGATLYDIKERYANAEVYGCDINAAAVSLAMNYADACVCNVEEQPLPWEKRSFDCVICGDILEHLRDPQRVLHELREYLTPDGYVVASIPNLTHISVMEELLRGNFTYTETGLLDKTHIHLFTFNEIFRTFTGAGYQIEQIEAAETAITPEQEQLIDRLMALDMGPNRLSYTAYQYILRACCAGGD